MFGAAGQLFYDSTDVTWNQVDMFLVGANAEARKSFPVIANKEVLVAQMMIDPPPIDRRAVAHNISVSGTTVYVGGGSESTYILVMMR